MIKSSLRDLTIGYIVKRKFVFEITVNYHALRKNVKLR